MSENDPQQQQQQPAMPDDAVVIGHLDGDDERKVEQAAAMLGLSTAEFIYLAVMNMARFVLSPVCGTSPFRPLPSRKE